MGYAVTPFLSQIANPFFYSRLPRLQVGLLHKRKNDANDDLEHFFKMTKGGITMYAMTDGLWHIS